MGHIDGPWTRGKYGDVIGYNGARVIFRGLSSMMSGSDEERDVIEANTDLALLAPEMLWTLKGALRKAREAMPLADRVEFDSDRSGPEWMFNVRDMIKRAGG